MVAQLCNGRLLIFSQLVSLQETFMVFLCVINLVFSIVAILGNVIIIRALLKSSSIPATLKTLLLSLTVSDLAVGFLVQPVFSSVIAVLLNTADHDRLGFLCPTILTTFVFLSYFLAAASFLSVAAIALDRLLALSLHLRYCAIITPKRVAIFTVILWTTSGVAASMFILLPSHNNLVIVPIIVIGILFTAVAYFQINRVVRHHRRQIKQQQLRAQNGQAVELARVEKSAFNTAYVYLVFLACYLPLLCSLILLAACDFHISFLAFRYFAMFIVFLNSSLNPFIYCWRYREIRKIARNMLKKVLIREPQN